MGYQSHFFLLSLYLVVLGTFKYLIFPTGLLHPFSPSVLTDKKLDANDVQRHVIIVSLPTKNIQSGPAFTLSQDILNLIKINDQTIQLEYNGKLINIIQSDIQASNGVIHIIDQVIV